MKIYRQNWSQLKKLYKQQHGFTFLWGVWKCSVLLPWEKVYQEKKEMILEMSQIKVWKVIKCTVYCTSVIDGSHGEGDGGEGRDDELEDWQLDKEGVMKVRGKMVSKKAFS